MLCVVVYWCFFFLQAREGIRVGEWMGVKRCVLPIVGWGVGVVDWGGGVVVGWGRGGERRGGGGGFCGGKGDCGWGGVVVG